MLDKMLLGAAFIQLAATILLMLWTGKLRVSALNSREVSLKDIALSGEKYPLRARQLANAYANQFQLPVLFYFAVLVALLLERVDMVGVILAWVFVASRLAHMFIHTGTNNLIHRFYAFLAGLIVLSLYLLWVFIPLFFSGGM